MINSKTLKSGFMPFTAGVGLKVCIAAALGGMLLLQSAVRLQATVYTYSVVIPATTAWTDTGIYVDPGTLLNIQASGTVYYGYQGNQFCGPNGGDISGTLFYADDVYSNAVVHSLIGKTGGTTALGTGTPVPEGSPGDGTGFVGSAYNQLISAGGELFLGFNDETGLFNDNSGSFNVIVTVPEPSSVALAGVGALASAAFSFVRRRPARR